MIRLFPCRPNINPDAGGGGKGCESGFATVSEKEPYWASGWPGGPGRLHLVCKGCSRTTVITPQEFWALPVATREQLEQWPGLLERLARDFTLGGEVEMEHAKDFVVSGVALDYVHGLEPPPKPEEG